jgi:hypothetical protein
LLLDGSHVQFSRFGDKFFWTKKSRKVNPPRVGAIAFLLLH